MNEYNSDIVRLYSVFFKSYNKMGKYCLMIPEFYSVSEFISYTGLVWLYVYLSLYNCSVGRRVF